MWTPREYTPNIFQLWRTNSPTNLIHWTTKVVFSLSSPEKKAHVSNVQCRDLVNRQSLHKIGGHSLIFWRSGPWVTHHHSIRLNEVTNLRGPLITQVTCYGPTSQRPKTSTDTAGPTHICSITFLGDNTMNVSTKYSMQPNYCVWWGKASRVKAA